MRTWRPGPDGRHSTTGSHHHATWDELRAQHDDLVEVPARGPGGRDDPGRHTVTWYLRSTSDRDTHHGELGADGTVAAACGVRFAPRPLPYDRVSLPGYPQDRDQICPQCDTIRRTRGAR
ncbi:MAG: hypothetical protein ACRDQY_21830 [Pseudonocardiaceae bacterium]